MIDRFFYWVFTLAMVIMIGWLVWASWHMATFNWEECETTDQYRDQHTAMWIQHMPRVCTGNPPVCTGGYTIVHPARDWTERLYICPDDNGTIERWRTEDRQ